MSVNRKALMSNAMKRTTEWIFSQEIMSDITIEVQGVSFSLHKFPLVSKCGYMRKLLSNYKETVDHVVKINNVPGGPEGFELAAKFCYGINFELSIENIAKARCVAEYLEMTEDIAVGNLVTRTESYLNEVGLNSLSGAVSILQSSERLLPVAENVKMITRCVDAIAYMVMKESQISLATSLACSSEGLGSSSSSLCQLKDAADWWAEDLIVLNIHTFQRVLLAMISRGFNKFSLGPIVTHYAQKFLRDLEISGKGKNKSGPNQNNEKRVVLETITSLLPREKNAISFSFLSTLLRSAINLETTVACRLDLEKRMGLQLSQAVLDDILIHSFRFDRDTLFDVDTIQRILMNYCESDANPDDIKKVVMLMENYLVEIASDCNLSLLKFINLIEQIPNRERVAEDGMYKAIDIYLKAHPVLRDEERKKLYSLINFEKLTSENDDLPNLQRENQDLKFELFKVKMILKDIERSDKSAAPTRSFMSFMSKKLMKFTPFLWVDHGTSPSITKIKNKESKDRRHSIS
ncbi:BTB/POZ domain-containing protein SR1IP1-like isoform X2 [Rutidosis leptorrhynchoides]|uniref:BTB/POZ domain-containing protein SR1IP1-like isoform X2 n=1 Tax=Rutidosis leptorrhynchoides TaxID=125765 RepID=UPI003A99E2F9